MGATYVISRGCEWCMACLHDGWGGDVTDEQAAILGDEVVRRFNARVPGILWTPSTSEVLGDMDNEYPDSETLNVSRQECEAEVLDQMLEILFPEGEP